MGFVGQAIMVCFDQTQICHINSCKSIPRCLRCGVPKGTNLGPLLFLIYIINDLPYCLTYSEPRMYADDTSLTLASTDIEHINYCLDHDLSNVYEWLSANKLTLNMTKTEFILIAPRQRLSQFTESPSLMYRSNRSLNIPRAYLGHLMSFPAREGGNLINLVFLGAGI